MACCSFWFGRFVKNFSRIFKALEQDIASHQSSISAIKAKVKTFVETADPSAAALLHSKMDTLCQRFSNACENHRQKVSKLEQLKEKVEKFEELADKVQQFVVKRSQDLHETDGPGKTFTELSQLMQVDVNINDHVWSSIVPVLLNQRTVNDQLPIYTAGY